MTIITIIILAKLILSIFFKPDFSNCYCGIFAFNGRKDLTIDQLKTAFYKFTILGLYNQSRGKDSCGIYVNNEIVKGVDKNKLFEDFIGENSFYLEEGITTMIGHCRQASRGAHTKENAHPIEAIHTEDIERNIILVHNGTIDNIWTLCTKRKINHATIHSDTVALTEIICNHGMDVLAEYTGAAALIWTDRSEQNRLYIFHGASRKFKTNEIDAERPLYYMETEEGIYISSIEKSLLAISDFNEEIFEVAYNTVFEVKDGKFTDFEYSVNRDDVNITKYDDYYNYNNNTDYRRNNNHKTNKNSLPIKLPISNPPSNKVSAPIWWLETIPTVIENRIFFCNGRYYKMGSKDLLNGELRLDKKGFLSIESSSKICYFYRGIMLKNRKAYDDVMKDINSTNSVLLDDSFNFACSISKYSDHPVLNLPNESMKMTNPAFRLKIFLNQKEYSGAFSTKFSSRTYKIDKGILLKIDTSLPEEKHLVLFYENYAMSARNKGLIMPKSYKVIEQKESDELDIVYPTYSELVQDITTDQYRAIRLIIEEELKQFPNSLDIDDDDIEQERMMKLRKIVEDGKTIREFFGATIVDFYLNYIKELREEELNNKSTSKLSKVKELFQVEENFDNIDYTNQEENMEKAKNLVTDLIDTLEDVNDIGEKLLEINNEFAQESATAINRALSALKSAICDSANKAKQSEVVTIFNNKINV